MKIIIDTNILISAALKGGKAKTTIESLPLIGIHY